MLDGDETVIFILIRELLMLNSLINLPASVPSLFRSLQAGKKRRTVISRNCFSSVENLEARELLSAANSVTDHAGVPRIINGTTTSSFTAVGATTYTSSGAVTTQAAGTLIDTQWVLTTATASKGLSGLTGGASASIVLGGTTYTVDQIVIYPKYYAGSIDYRQDIALWHLSTAVPGTITPLIVSRTPFAANGTATLVGFGGTGTGTTGTDGTFGTKQTATTKVERVSASQLVWKLDTTEGTFAPNDIGAPVLKLVGSTYQVFGLNTYHSTTTGKKGDMSYSTRTDFYTGWIDNTLGLTHPAGTTDDYIDTANLLLTGTQNRKFTLNATTSTADFTGKFNQYGDVDVFKVVTALDGYATFALINSAPSASLLDTKLEILASDGETVLFTSDDNSNTDLNSSIGTYLATGTYFVRVSTYANSQKGTYRLTIKDNFDNVSDTMGSAKALTPSSIGAIASDVFINTTTDVDWFKFKANKSGKFQFDFTHTNPAAFDPVLEVFSSVGVSLGQNDDIGGTGANRLDARVTVNGIVSGQTYYLKLSGYSVMGVGSTGLGKLAGKKIA